MSDFISVPRCCSLADAERIVVEDTLDACQWDVAVAAKILRIPAENIPFKISHAGRLRLRAEGPRSEQRPAAFVYCIRDDARSLAKIGWSARPLARLKILSAASGAELRLVHCVECNDSTGAKLVESRLHNRFSGRLILSEWFDDSGSIVSDSFVSLASELLGDLRPQSQGAQ